MTNSKTTKKALLSSTLALTMCVAMLIATTFAWFTDTASTAVNKIQSGTLDVALEMATAWDEEGVPNTWGSAEGKTLEFKKATGADENEAVLWEPGCTYKLPELRVVNNGNLALKYKVIISGIQGSAKLNEVIDWTIVNDADEATTDLSTTEYHLTKKGSDNDSDILTISGHMRETAGNDYQNLTIDGISITVVATQDTVEYDSGKDTYDEYAEYPVVAVTQVAVDDEKKTTAETTIKSVETVSQENTTSLATATIPEGVKTTAADGDTDTQLKLTVNDASVPANFTYDAENQVAKTLEVKMEGLASENETPIKVEMYVGTGMHGFKLYHNNAEMTSVANAESVSNDQEYYYDSTSGMVTMKTATFSPFTYVYDASIKVASMEDLSVASSADWARIVKPGYYKLTQDITVSGKTLYVDTGGVDINLNGKTLTIDGKNFVNNGTNVVDAKFHNGNIAIKNSGKLWSSSWGTTNLTFDDVYVSAGNTEDVIKAAPAEKDCTLNIVGSNFNITDGRFLWANPMGDAAAHSKVTVTASGVNVKQKTLAKEAVMLQTQYSYGEIEANFTSCTFDSSNRSEEPVKISSYATNSGNRISLTMNGCSLIAQNPDDLSDYIKDYSAENVTLTLNNCTGNGNAALTK